MTKQQPATQPTIAVSPYLSLRQAVRPLIFAHALLTREQERAGELAEECSRLRQLTQELLEAAALVHLLAPDKSEEVIDTPGDKRSRQIIDAYAKAGLMWAEVTGSAMALADALVGDGRWDDVHRLATFLDAADEPAVAEDLRTRANAAALRATELQLAKILPNMTEPEITSAIEALRKCRSEDAVSFYIRDLASAILNVAPNSWREEYVAELDSAFRSNGIHWEIGPGDRVLRDAKIISWYTSVHWEHTIPFPAVVTDLLVADGTTPGGRVALASVIRIPDPIADELEQEKLSTVKVFERLDKLARIFSQIQAENNRGRDKLSANAAQ